MSGPSMKKEDFIKLSHFDRVRRGHYNQIPSILMLLGFSGGIHILHLNPNTNVPIIFAIVCFGIGACLKYWFLEKDDKELAGMKNEIELDFRKRLNKEQKK